MRNNKAVTTGMREKRTGPDADTIHALRIVAVPGPTLRLPCATITQSPLECTSKQLHYGRIYLLFMFFAISYGTISI